MFFFNVLVCFLEELLVFLLFVILLNKLFDLILYIFNELLFL